ncbi:MAG: membrane protein insertase Oxa1/YidC/SpoIIIJ [Candidatus Azotimanducaceae bacterium]|jgi:membrane protein insertase Oxa1/YidC/SpoIIIJ
METDDAEHGEMKALLKRNSELIEENNKLLKKLHRNAVWGFWMRIVWYAVLIGLPFALYFYVLEPYFTALGSDYEIFKAGMQELPGLKTLIGAFGSGQ